MLYNSTKTIKFIGLDLKQKDIQHLQRKVIKTIETKSK